VEVDCPANLDSIIDYVVMRQSGSFGPTSCAL